MTYISLESKLASGKDAPLWIIHMCSIKQLKNLQNKTPMYLAFIDYGKAFDSEEIPAILQTLHCQAVPNRYMNTIANIYRKSTAEQKNSNRERVLARRCNLYGVVHRMLRSIRATMLGRSRHKD